MAEMHLNTRVTVQESLRKGFGRGLVEAGKRFDNVVAACADLTESTQMHLFAEAFPDRFVEVGVAEQNLVTVASGMTALGKVPYVSSYAAFSPGRNWEQIRTTIALNNRPVRIVGSHAGVSVGPDGATHQMLEDLAIMRAMPNMVVIAPCDSMEAYKATIALAQDPRPAYIRLARNDTPVITTLQTPFNIGPAYVFHEGTHVTIVSTGTMTPQAMEAAKILVKNDIYPDVIHVPTLKPIDSETILNSAVKTRHVVTAEEGQINGGLGSAVAELLGEYLPTPMIRIGIRDHFGESGQPADLLKKFGLTDSHIADAARHLLQDHTNHKH